MSGLYPTQKIRSPAFRAAGGFMAVSFRGPIVARLAKVAFKSFVLHHASRLTSDTYTIKQKVSDTLTQLLRRTHHHLTAHHR
jgi:hypothetical protein